MREQSSSPWKNDWVEEVGGEPQHAHGPGQLSLERNDFPLPTRTYCRLSLERTLPGHDSPLKTYFQRSFWVSSRVLKAWVSRTSSNWSLGPSCRFHSSFQKLLPRCLAPCYQTVCLRFQNYVSSQTAFLEFRCMSHFPLNISPGRLIETPTRAINFPLKHA